MHMGVSGIIVLSVSVQPYVRTTGVGASVGHVVALTSAYTTAAEVNAKTVGGPKSVSTSGAGMTAGCAVDPRYVYMAERRAFAETASALRYAFTPGGETTAGNVEARESVCIIATGATVKRALHRAVRSSGEAPFPTSVTIFVTYSNEITIIIMYTLYILLCAGPRIYHCITTPLCDHDGV